MNAPDDRTPSDLCVFEKSIIREACRPTSDEREFSPLNTRWTQLP